MLLFLSIPRDNNKYRSVRSQLFKCANTNTHTHSYKDTLILLISCSKRQIIMNEVKQRISLSGWLMFSSVHIRAECLMQIFLNWHHIDAMLVWHKSGILQKQPYIICGPAQECGLATTDLNTSFLIISFDSFLHFLHYALGQLKVELCFEVRFESRQKFDNLIIQTITIDHIKTWKRGMSGNCWGKQKPEESLDNS